MILNPRNIPYSRIPSEGHRYNRRISIRIETTLTASPPHGRAIWKVTHLIQKVSNATPPRQLHSGNMANTHYIYPILEAQSKISLRMGTPIALVMLQAK